MDTPSTPSSQRRARQQASSPDERPRSHAPDNLHQEQAPNEADVESSGLESALSILREIRTKTAAMSKALGNASERSNNLQRNQSQLQASSIKDLRLDLGRLTAAFIEAESKTDELEKKLQSLSEDKKLKAGD